MLAPASVMNGPATFDWELVARAISKKRLKNKMLAPASVMNGPATFSWELVARAYILKKEIHDTNKMLAPAPVTKEDYRYL